MLKNKLFIMFLILGLLYIDIEVIFRALTNAFQSILHLKYLSLMGCTSIWMGIVGGVSGLAIGTLNECNFKFRNYPVIDAIVGSIFILFVELISGIILNVWFGLNLWNYSKLPFNILGQICLLYGFLWFLLVPFGMWIDDLLKILIFKEGHFYSLFDLYKAVFTFKKFDY